MKLYDNFEELEAELRQSMPKIIYKFRDWGESYHKTILANRELYFAHPHSLNDPFDVRVPHNFIIGDLDYDIAREIIRERGREINPDLTDEQLDLEVDKRLLAFKSDPVGYYQMNRIDWNQGKSNFDKIGILSLCATFDNVSMWAHYGSNHKGFAVGFNTVELARSLDCGVGWVEYSNVPLDYFIMGDNFGHIYKEIFRKSEIWRSEQEIRFVTAGIGIVRDRTCYFLEKDIVEIIIGLHTSQETEQEIIQIVKQSFPNVKLYKLVLKTESYGFDKMLIRI